MRRKPGSRKKRPELFEQIKILCDESKERGLFWLTGSQQFKMMKNIRETLAGRIGILELYSFSKNETEGLKFSNEMDFSLPCLLARQPLVPKNDIVQVFEHIWRGGMPDAQEADSEQRQEYFNSYIETYLMRDVADGSISHGYSKGLRTLRVIPGRYHQGNVKVDGFKRYTYESGSLKVEQIDIRTYWTNLSNVGYENSEDVCGGGKKGWMKGWKKGEKKK